MQKYPQRQPCLKFPGKVQYPDYETARNAATIQNGRGGATYKNYIRPYRCAYCKEYHIGHPMV